MDINCDALDLYLSKYAQIADKPDGPISEVIKAGLQKAAHYNNERAQWKSAIHKNVLSEDIFRETELQIREEDVIQFHKNGKERLKAINEALGNSKNTPKTQVAPSSHLVQKTIHNFGFKSLENNETGLKRKIDTCDNLNPAPKLKNVEQPSWSHARPTSSSSFVPKSNWQNPHTIRETSAGSGYNPSIQLWSAMNKPSEPQGHFGATKPPAEIPVVRKYAPNLPPVKPHPSNKPASENRVPPTNTGPFRSARDELAAQNIKKYGHPGAAAAQNMAPKRSLGARRGGVYGKFVPPKKVSENGEIMDDSPEQDSLEPEDERLRNIDPKMVEMITNEIMYVGKPVEWDDIAGLEFAKTTIQEIVVWPLLRPDIFSGLRGPPKGILLFGPPGTGKTLIGKCIAAQSKSTFFSISASSLTSKWVGDGEKMVRALFAVARCHQPAVIFIDEIDSLLSQRSDTEHESSRRIKTEFLVQLDGATTAEDERILVVGATNRPQELDEAARRRLVKRLYIPLPEQEARAQMVHHLMSEQRCILTEADVQEIARLAEGFSGADMRDLCREAAYGPIRSIDVRQMEHINPEQVRPVTVQDFRVALQQVRPSVSSKDLQSYEEWNKTYGYGNC